MLKIGIVGKKNYKTYYNSITEDKKYRFTGVFDSEFQFEPPHYINPTFTFFNYNKLLDKSDVLIFSSGERIFLPLIEKAVKKSKPVFLHSLHNFDVPELTMLQKLTDEARSIIQIYHPFVFNEAFSKLKEMDTYPLLIESKLAGNSDLNLLPYLRNHILAFFCLTKSPIRKITTNLISTFSEIPDIAKLRIDFTNSCIADLHINSVENKRKHTIDVYSLNSQTSIDLEKNTMFFQNKQTSNVFSCQKEENSNIPHIKKQLTNFYLNVMHDSSPLVSVEKHLETQKVVDKVMEKLRLCINL